MRVFLCLAGGACGLVSSMRCRVPDTPMIAGSDQRIVTFLLFLGAAVLVILTEHEGDYTIATLPLLEI